MLDVKIKRLSDSATIPTYGSEEAACIDLYANIGFTTKHYVDADRKEPATLIIPPHKTIKVGCGFAFQPPKGYAGLIFARSGISTKQGLRPANCVGVCDSDYLDEYIVPLHNDSNENRMIHHGDRIAQLMFIPVEQMELKEVKSFRQTKRGFDGFCSTGV